MENQPNSIPNVRVVTPNIIKATPKEVAKQMANSKQGEAPDVAGKMTGGEVVKTKVNPVAAILDKAQPDTKTEPEAKLEAVEKTEETKPDESPDKLTARFASLAKKERQLEITQSAHNKAVKEFETTKQTHDTEVQEWMNIKKSPKMFLEVMEKFGVPFTKLAEYILTPEAVDKDFENKKFREEYENDKKSREEAEKTKAQKQYEDGIANFKNDLKTFIDGNNEAYELIAKQNKYDLVYDVMNEQYKKDGTTMDKEVASKMVEDFLMEEAKELLKAKKLSNLPTSESSNESINEEGKKDKEIKATMNKPQAAKSAVVTKTLTNLKATLITDTRNEAKTEQERKARALAAFKSRR